MGTEKDISTGPKAGLRAWIAAAVAALAVAAAAPAGSAADIIGPQDPNDPKVDSPWQAGTCTSDTPTCSVETPSQFFERAAAHPPVGFTQFIVNHEEALPGTETPVGNLRTVRVDIPEGFTVNPQATPERCELGPEESPAGCPAGSKVGTSEVTATNPSTGFSQTLPTADVFNIVPEHGEPARFGFSVLGNDVFLETGVAWDGDYHEHFTIHAHKLELGVPGLEVARIAKNRLVFDGTAGDGTFLTTPVTCRGEALPGSPFEHVYSTFLRADSFEEPDPSFPAGSAFVEAKIPPGTEPRECGTIPFDPAIEVDPDTSLVDSPAGPEVRVTLPEVLGAGEQATSHVRAAEVELPEGMGLNPAAANGLEACTDGEFGKGTRGPVACPAASRVGSVEVETPPLPPGSLRGEVYAAEQRSRDPASGELFRIFVHVEAERYGISARLVGNVAADPRTGQLTTTFAENPQVPFTSFEIDFDGGPTATLTSPSICGEHRTRTAMTPWSGNPDATPADGFTLSSAPGGGSCPGSLGARPFAPGFGARVVAPRAGAFSPVWYTLVRPQGQQELKGAVVDLPPGLAAKLAGVAYCPEAAIAVAAANSGTAEAARPSCPASSYVGSVSTFAGSGPAPLHIAGKAFLAGPYRGAPLSLAVVTPATAGPYDLGSVVVRVALFVDPRTARIRAVSDPIPHVFGGVLLGIRSILVRVDRPRFSLNPTGCRPTAVWATVRGGGADPGHPAAFSAVPVPSHFQIHGCGALGFEPKLFLRLFGATRRAKNPKLRAVVLPGKGDANIGRAAVILPRTLILDQANIRRVCTRVQFAARACPKRSIYGHARAFSPLLDEPLRGPVYLRSSDNLLPDLVASLRGQVEVELAGRTDSVRGRIRNVFDVVPDVPVSKFILTLRGGKRGLLVNSSHLCGKRGKGRAIAKLRAHSGKKAKLRPRLRRPCGGERRQPRKHRRHGRR